MLVWLVAGAAEAADHGVDVLDNRFEPATITIAPGDRVTWTNRGQSPHTVTADNGSFDSQKNERFITPIRPFTQKFDEPGRYPYHCEVHTDMKGVVIVRRASATSTTSSTTTTTRPPRTTSTLEPGGSAITAPGETTSTTEASTTTVEQTTTTTDDAGLATGGGLGDGDDNTSTGLAAALASLLLLGVSGGTLFLMRKGELA